MAGILTMGCKVDAFCMLGLRQFVSDPTLSRIDLSKGFVMEENLWSFLLSRGVGYAYGTRARRLVL